jgi:hypothetical protein
LPSSSVQSQPSTLPQSTAAGNLELLGMASDGSQGFKEIGAKVF